MIWFATTILHYPVTLRNTTTFQKHSQMPVDVFFIVPLMLAWWQQTANLPRLNCMTTCAKWWVTTQRKMARDPQGNQWEYHPSFHIKNHRNRSLCRKPACILDFRSSFHLTTATSFFFWTAEGTKVDLCPPSFVDFPERKWKKGGKKNNNFPDKQDGLVPRSSAENEVLFGFGWFTCQFDILLPIMFDIFQSALRDIIVLKACGKIKVSWQRLV